MKAGIYKKGKAAAVILAGGSGSRFAAGGEKKQFVSVLGVPVLVRSCLAFDSSPLIDEIVVVAPADDLERTRQLLAGKIGKLRGVVPGGETRQASAKAGLDAIGDRMAYIAIHDAARCLVTAEMIGEVFRAAYRTGGAIAATPARDTIKTADKDNNVAGTVDRSTAWYAATPQVFRTTSYRAAAYVASRDEFVGTDDASLLEYIGQPVAIVDTGDENIKITYPVDIAVAEAVLQYREKETKA